jgi:hypothetical protein
LATYGLIAEDGAIEEAVPILMRRILETEGLLIERRRMNGKDDFVANFWKRVKEFQLRYPSIHKVLAVCDADRESADQLESTLRIRAATGRTAVSASLPCDQARVGDVVGGRHGGCHQGHSHGR